MRLLRNLLLLALFIFVGIPCLFVLFVLGMSMFGIVLGIGGAMIGIMLAIIKIALIIILPIALLVWLFRTFFGAAKG
jgi:hypothetical protein